MTDSADQFEDEPVDEEREEAEETEETDEAESGPSPWAKTSSGDADDM